MKEQKTVLEEKTREIVSLTAELADLRGRRAGSTDALPSVPESSPESEVGAQQLHRNKPGNPKRFLRASICDDGRYLAESLEGKHHTGYHIPPSWAKTQSTGSPPRTSPHNSFQRRSFTPQSSKRRSEQESITRKNSEEGLVLKFSEERRKSVDMGPVVKDSVSKKLEFSQSEEEAPTSPEKAEPEDEQHPKVRKTNLQLAVFQGKSELAHLCSVLAKQTDWQWGRVAVERDSTLAPSLLPRAVQSPSLLPGEPGEGNLSLAPSEVSGEVRSKLRGILKGGQSWAGRDEVNLARPVSGKTVKFDGISMLFSAAMEGEYEVFVEASQQVC